MQRAIEEAGIPTIIIAALPPVVRQTGTPRAVAPLVPMGANAGEPNNPDMQRDIVKATLEQLVAIDTPGKVVSLTFEYFAKVCCKNYGICTKCTDPVFHIKELWYDKERMSKMAGGDKTMGEETKELRRLVIKAYHVREVQWGSENEVTENGILTVDKESSGRYKRGKEEYISDISFRIIRPEERDQYTNTIMDIIPISAKVLGDIGDGITHTLTGVYVILTGVDTVGKQTHEFGSSEGNLLEQMKYGKAGTPGENDAMITFDVTLREGMGQIRAGVTAAHRACDEFVQEFREQLRKFHGDKCTERHEFYDVVRPGKKKVLIIKQVAGQGAMYDMHLFAKEPSGVEGSRSIIDMGNMPVLVTPNEYRDGILRSMQ